MITCLIIDDQEDAIDVLVDYVKNIPELNLVKTFTKPVDAIKFLEKNKIDLVFLDVEMPHLNGIEFIESLRAKKGNDIPAFIFATGHNKFAMSGYEQGVSDYLTKPIGFKRFKVSVDRIIDRMQKNSSNSESKADFFFTEVDGKKQRINFKDIFFVKAEGNYVTISTDRGNKTVHRTMNLIEEELPAKQFMRVHKSFIISLDLIDTISANEIVITIKGIAKNIPIGITYKEALFKRLKII